MSIKTPARLSILVVLSILAFAGNSLLTRAALAQSSLSPGSFTGVRLLSGALVLAAIAAMRGLLEWPGRADLPGALFLSLYAIAFTFAYVAIGAASGALILFASVQLSMVAVTWLRGGRISPRALLGMALAFCGLVWLLLPGAAAAAPSSALLMVLAGGSWGLYTLAGRSGGDPLATTTRNFVATAPLALILIAAFGSGDRYGLLLAVVSGAVTSALGYALWYTVLPHLSVATAGAAQLLVPPVAAMIAWGWLDEPLSGRFVAGATLILAGIGLTIMPARSVREAGGKPKA